MSRLAVDINHQNKGLARDDRVCNVGAVLIHRKVLRALIKEIDSNGFYAEETFESVGSRASST